MDTKNSQPNPIRGIASYGALSDQSTKNQNENTSSSNDESAAPSLKVKSGAQQITTSDPSFIRSAKIRLHPSSDDNAQEMTVAMPEIRRSKGQKSIQPRFVVRPVRSPSIGP